MIEYQGEKFREYLKKRIVLDKTKPKSDRLTMQKAIEMMGISKTNMYQYFESRSLKRETVHKILTVFNATEEEVFGADPDKLHIVNEATAIYSRPLIKSSDEPGFTSLGNGQYLIITPLVDEYAQAGYISGFSNSNYMNELPKHSIIVNRLHDGNHVSFIVTEPSMDDDTKESIPEGAIVTGLEIETDQLKRRFAIKLQKDFVIVHQDGILVRRIIGHDPDKGKIVCRALNPDRDNYPDLELDTDDIRQLFRIIKKEIEC